MNNINWSCKTDAGETLDGFTEDGSWRELKKTISSKNLKITTLNIRNEYGGATIDPNADGYFISNKILAKMGGNVQEFVGIGYWKKEQDVVRIKWYDAKTMNLWSNEARSLNDCSEDCLIKNI